MDHGEWFLATHQKGLECLFLTPNPSSASFRGSVAESHSGRPALLGSVPGYSAWRPLGEPGHPHFNKRLARLFMCYEAWFLLVDIVRRPRGWEEGCRSPASDPEGSFQTVVPGGGTKAGMSQGSQAVEALSEDWAAQLQRFPKAPEGETLVLGATHNKSQTAREGTG